MPVLTACPFLSPEPISSPTPEPLSSPSVETYPTVEPTILVTPTPTVTASGSGGLGGLGGGSSNPLPPLQVTELDNGDLISDSFKLNFGPGSKNVKLDFGPGSKPVSLEFGPGSKGPQNLDFRIDFPSVLTNPNLDAFSLQQLGIGGALLNQLNLEIIRDNLLYATAEALPRRSEIEVPARFHPGTYSVSVVAQTVNGPLQMSWSKFEVLPDFNAELKVSVFGEANAKPEDLDIEVLSRNRIPRSAETEPTPEPTLEPSVAPTTEP